MKNLIFFATLLIFMLNISDNVINAEAKDEGHDPVLDTDGKELETGTSSYYIVPPIWPFGGISIYPLANKTCTSAVAQIVLLGDGLPVTFANGGSNLGEVVRESTDLKIAFKPGMLICPAVWKVDEYDEAAKQHFVIAGKIDGNETSINKWFQIRKVNLWLIHVYKFVSCSKDCESCAQICTDVGIHIHEGVWRFAVGGLNIPFTFRFKKFSPGTDCHALEA